MGSGAGGGGAGSAHSPCPALSARLAAALAWPTRHDVSGKPAQPGNSVSASDPAHEAARAICVSQALAMRSRGSTPLQRMRVDPSAVPRSDRAAHVVYSAKKRSVHCPTRRSTARRHRAARPSAPELSEKTASARRRSETIAAFAVAPATNPKSGASAQVDRAARSTTCAVFLSPRDG
jgi:hypothetical protein